MFDLAFESLRKATDATMQTQQEMFKKWASLWPGVPTAQPVWGEQVKQFQKKWAEFVRETLTKQNEVIREQFNIGLKNLEGAFQVAEAKDVQELRTRTVELWRKSFECLRQAFEAQGRDFQAAVTRWTELTTKAPSA